MKIAIIGSGSIGSAVAKNLSGVQDMEVLIASTSPEKDLVLANSLAENIKVETVDNAIELSEIVIFAVWFDAIRELLKTKADLLKDKIIIDPSNPIGMNDAGELEKKIPEDQSSGLILLDLSPQGSIFVKAFGTLSADSLGKVSHSNPPFVLFYASDETSADAKIESLIKASGFDPVKVGGIKESIKIEVFGELHEMGGLSKPILKEDALKLIGK